MSDASTLFEITVEESEHGLRLDAVLALRLDAYSRVFLRRVVQDKRVLVDGEVVKPSFRVQTGQAISVDLPPPPDDGPKPENIPLDVLFEDEAFVAINKAPGMVVHPAKGNWGGTLASALAFRFQSLSDVGGPTRPGIVHRLDRDTSGVILVAKSNQVHLKLSEQFAERTIEKEYFALTIGKVQMDRDVIKQPIGPHPYQRDKMAIRSGHPKSRDAETWYEVTHRWGGISAVTVRPKTGRTHQIRVHLSHVGAPVLCDRLYAGHAQVTRGELLRRQINRQPSQAGDDDVLIKRQALHAHRIALTHPTTGEPMEIVCPLPEDIQSIIDTLNSAE